MSVSVESDLESLLTRLQAGRGRIREGRRRGLVQVGQLVLRDVIGEHPVETGRSQAGWSAALSALGLTTGDGAGDAGGEGEASVIEEAEQTEVEAINFVEYEPFVEYGSRGRSGTGSVRRSLDENRSQGAEIVGKEIARAAFEGSVQL